MQRVELSPEHRALLRRHRELIRRVASLEEELALAAIAADNMPLSYRERMAHRREELAQAQAEREAIRPAAEAAAAQIGNEHLRRYAEAYCLDGATYSVAAALCGASKRQAARYGALLNG